jgi:hypothetical protein
VVVEEEVRSDNEQVVTEPCDGTQRQWRNGKLKEGAEAVSGACPEQPGDCGKEKDGGGLGEDHEGQENAEGENGRCLEEMDSKRSGRNFLPLRCGVRSSQKSQQGEENEKRLEDGHAGEDVAKGTDGE